MRGLVTRAVEALAAAAGQRVGDEPLGRERRAAEITAGETGAADHQLAGHTDRQRPQLWIEHVEVGSGDRATDGQGAAAPLVCGTVHEVTATVASVGP